MDTPRFLKNIDEVANAKVYAENAQAYIELLVEKKLEQFQTKAKDYKALATTLGEVVPSGQGAVPAPAELIAAINDLRTESVKFNEGLNHLRLLLISRTPQMKEEDNAGVAIQQHIAELLDAYSDALTGLGGKSKDAASISLAPLSLKKDYFAARATAEEKVHKSTCGCGDACKCGVDGKDCGCNRSKETTTSPFVLHQIDADTALKVAQGFTKLHQAAFSIVVNVSRNAGKILVPRRSGSSMIH